jgi:hypothetical protein
MFTQIPVYFNTTPQEAVRSTREEIEIGKYMRGAFAAFARDTTAGLLTYGTGWPIYSPQENTLVQLAYENKTGTNLAKGNLYDGRCAT